MVSVKLIEFCCYGCGAELDDAPAGYGCPVCGEPMSVRVIGTPPASLFRERPASLWHYGSLLPVDESAGVVSLDEGATPLVDAPRVARALGIGQLLIKNEMQNPTGSFKDRQVSVSLSHARQQGATTVAAVSSGNVACAVSAYAARAGMRAVLFMHGHAAPGTIRQAAVYGGIPVQVPTPSAKEAFDLCIAACATFGWAHISTAGMYNPYAVEGAKTIAYELYQQTGGDLPEWIVAPVGGGGLLGGIWRGFLDLQRMGLVKRLPRLAGVQAAGCAPLKKAIDLNQRFLDTLRDPWQNPKTIAGGIADDILFDGHTVLPAIRMTSGAALAVDDSEILAALKMLARREGVWCEPTSAAAVAGLFRLPDVGPETRVCCIVTGAGLKDPGVVDTDLPEPVRLTEASIPALRAALGEPSDHARRES